MQIAVLQLGARRHYAVPAALARAGMLQRLYTDFCADTVLFRQLERFWPTSLRPAAIQRMFGRRLPAVVPLNLVRTVPLAFLCQELAWRVGLSRSWVDASESLLALASRDKFGNADALYSFLTSDLDLSRQARQLGVRIVHDVILGPDEELWLAEERRRFPDVEPEPHPESVAAARERFREKCRLADLIIVPSAFTGRAVLDLVAVSNCVVEVPHGLEARWLTTSPMPQPGRVLFVGSVGLRKGVPYLAAACRLLKQRGVACEVRIVGPYPSGLIDRPEFVGPTYLGQIPRNRILDEFLLADVFVLPTLHEGCALAHLEALASGLPVITTPNCGSVVRDGADGFIVPIRDPRSLADHIERVVKDRVLRRQLSRNAHARATEFTWDRYGERLIRALSCLQPRDDHHEF